MLKNSGNESIILTPLEYNYHYEFQIRLANKEKHVKMLKDGTQLYSTGVDCYRETNDYEYCSTLDPQYPSAPADVHVSSVVTGKESEIFISWLRPLGTNTQTISIRTAPRGYLNDDNESKVDRKQINDTKEIKIESSERVSTKIIRQLEQNTMYDLEMVGLTSEGRAGITTVVQFNTSELESPTEIPGKTTQGSSSTYIIVIVMVVAVSIACTFISCGYSVRRKRLRSMPHFKRDPDTVSVSKGIDEKDIEECLKESEYGDLEFGRHLLKLEEVLGSGQFGIVYKGYALGIDGGVDYVQVAVKCLKSNASQAMKEDFLDEIRLIDDIGNHANILSVLGCCTLKEPYYLITEYMRYGDLLHFLQRCKPKFAIEDPIYDLTEENRIQIARQIARGMDYLSKTRYYHGDLAARNVLVGTGMIVKISDFGLADDIYQSGYKRLAPEKKRPIKWVSLETNEEGKCTIKSDVWSFGIVLYEIYTNGGMPYPEMDASSVIQKLSTGYRMERPDECPIHIYEIMLECWKAIPNQRPTFNDLFLTFDKLLEMDSDYLETDICAMTSLIQKGTTSSLDNV
ncbi:tyrosine-protein kinase FRK-like [Antedon mediterranea]|uniref:tyrosine-protein kinase FRK-like n=1 Tax=Antedon mediterranea TaxID=105859 RepID=UPI003AF4DEC2